MKKGFTLIELLAVITVLAIILVIAIPNIQHLIDEKKKDTFLINAKSIIKQIKYEDKNFLTTQLSELNLEGIAKDGYDADLSTAYISDEEIHLNLVGAGQYKGMYLCNVNLTTNKSEVQNTPCEAQEKYIVTFDPNGGSVGVSSKEVIYNSTYGNLPIPKKEGYKFLGWNGKNMFNEEKLLMAISGAKYENGYYIFTSVKAYNKYGNGNSIPIYNFKENTRYTTSIYGYTAKSGWNYNFWINYNYLVGDSHFERFNLDQYGKFVFTSYANRTLKNITISYNSSTTNYVEHMQLEEGSSATEYEPYYVTKDVKVTQRKNHTLKAIWEEI